jgi:hypothetical protein
MKGYVNRSLMTSMMSQSLFEQKNPFKINFDSRFFSELPKQSGIYKMYGEDGELLYVGKAKNLKARLLSYRNARLTRLSRKTRFLLHQVRRIDFEVQASEQEALLLENQNIRSLKPRFNRLSKNPEAYCFLGLRFWSSGFEYRFVSGFEWRDSVVRPSRDFHMFGCFRARSRLRECLQRFSRVFWRLIHEEQTERIPLLLMRERPPLRQSILWLKPNPFSEKKILRYFRGTSIVWIKEAREKITQAPLDPFEKYLLMADLDFLEDCYSQYWRAQHKLRQRFGLGQRLLLGAELDDLLVKNRFVLCEPV